MFEEFSVLGIIIGLSLDAPLRPQADLPAGKPLGRGGFTVVNLIKLIIKVVISYSDNYAKRSGERHGVSPANFKCSSTNKFYQLWYAVLYLMNQPKIVH